MRKFIWECICITIVFFAVIALTNYFGDPANLYHEGTINELVSLLAKGNIVSKSGDMDERMFQKVRIESLQSVPETVILGSSHVVYVPWEFEAYYVGGVSGAVLNDYIGILGILDYYGKLPSTIVIGVDPYIFYDKFDEKRYQSIQKFVDLGYRILRGEEGKNDEMDKDFIQYQLLKAKELISLSYFQNSLKLMIKNSFRQENHVLSVEDTSIGEDLKVLPNGRYIPRLSTFCSIEENRNITRKNIDSQNIYKMNGFSDVSDEKKELFELMTEYLLSEEIKIEIYLPAWYPDYYEEFKKNDTLFGVLKAEEYIREMAAERNIPVHGSYDPDKVGVTEKDFMDDMHLTPEAAIQEYNVILQ